MVQPGVESNLALVSVVITTYNRPEHLADALKTTMNQSIKDLEIIVVDGMNSDENKSVVDKAKDKRIKYVGLKEDRGIQHSRTTGCQKSTGKYIAMLDDDDLWAPNKLERQLKEFKDDSIGLVGCNTKVYTDEDSFFIETLPTNPTYQDLLKSFSISKTSSLLIRNDVMKEIGYFDEKLRGMHEHDIALKVAKKGHVIVNVPEPLLIRYPQEKGKSLERSYYHKIAETMDLWHHYGKDFIPNLGIRGFVLNGIKTVGLFGIFLLGYVIKDKVWKIIHPLNRFYLKIVVK